MMMMTTTTIGFHASVSSTTRSYSSMDTAETVISEAIGASSIIHDDNGKRPLLEGQRKGQLGQCKWTVVCESELSSQTHQLREEVIKLTERMTSQGVELASLGVELASHVKKFDVLEQLTITPYLRNVAATILLYLAGIQPKTYATASKRFLSMVEPHKLRVENCASSIGLTNTKFKTLADIILDRRNDIIHPTDIVVLELMVKGANDMIDAYPRMRIFLKDEVFMIENFED